MNKKELKERALIILRSNLVSELMNMFDDIEDDSLNDIRHYVNEFITVDKQLDTVNEILSEEHETWDDIPF